MTALVVKLIAVSSMLVDHTGAVFDLHFGFRIIGRIAFPLFVYLIAQSCRHTRSMEKYLIRLGIFAIISQIPFDMAFNDYISFTSSTNIFYTLWLGVLCVYIFQSLYGYSQKGNYIWILSAIPVTAAMMAADWVGSDFGGRGVLFVFFVAIAGYIKFSGFVKYIQFAIMAVFMFWLYLPSASLVIGGLSAVVIAGMMDTSKASKPYAWTKWIFYFVYPVHLLVLALVNIFID